MMKKETEGVGERIREKKENWSMRVCYNHKIVMRDQATLRGNLYLPERGKACPVILMRTVFRKDTLSKSWGIFDPEYYVRNGYAVYIQDVRGIGESEGEFMRFCADRQDAYDTVEALAHEPWCDGNVGMFGNFFAGFLEFQAAAAKPPHLKAICPFETHVSLNRNNDTRGVTMFYAHIGWCLAREVSRMLSGHYSVEIVDKYLPVVRHCLENYADLVANLPAEELPMKELKEIFPLVRDYFDIALPGYDDVEIIKGEGRLMDLAQLEVPALLLAGWRETSRNTMIEHGDTLRRCGKGNAALSEVIIGNWKSGEPMSMGETALHIPENHFHVEGEILRWFDRWLKGKSQEKKAPFRLFDPGLGTFVELDEWKENGVQSVTWYLESQGHANTARGDGRLKTDHPGYLSGSDNCLYDPKNPAPGGGYGDDCRASREREDILVYTSGILDKDICVRGVPKVILYASSSAPDTDFIAWLVDVDCEGGTVLAGDGIVRAGYRDSWDFEPLEPGKMYRFEIKVSDLVYTFRKGHRLRLEIRNSDFPKFEANRNTGKRPETDNGRRIAKNMVYHGTQTASRLILPCG